MRCASCSTENAPDSRFCGGCGARLVSSGVRVAPTQKISDDASYPATGAAPGAAYVTPKRQTSVPSAPSSAPANGPMAAIHAGLAPNAGINTTQPGVTPARPPTLPPPIFGASGAPHPVGAAPGNGGGASAAGVVRGRTPTPTPARAARTSTPQHAPREQSSQLSSQPRAVAPSPRHAPQIASRDPSALDASVSNAPDVSMPIARRRPWGWIAVVLVIDTALAVSGAWMLMSGLGERAANAPRTGASVPTGSAAK